MKPHHMILSCILLLSGPAFGYAIEEVKPGDPWRRPRTVEHIGLHKVNEKGLQYIERGKYKKAIELYKGALDEFKFKRVQDDSFLAELLFNYSTALYEYGKNDYFHYKDDMSFQKALQSAQQCIELQPDRWQAYEIIAQVYLKMKDLEKADHYYEETKKHMVPGTEDYQKEYNRIDKRHQLIKRVLELNQSKDQK